MTVTATAYQNGDNSVDHSLGKLKLNGFAHKNLNGSHARSNGNVNGHTNGHEDKAVLVDPFNYVVGPT